MSACIIVYRDYVDDVYSSFMFFLIDNPLMYRSYFKNYLYSSEYGVARNGSASVSDLLRFLCRK